VEVRVVARAPEQVARAPERVAPELAAPRRGPEVRGLEQEAREPEWAAAGTPQPLQPAKVQQAIRRGLIQVPR